MLTVRLMEETDLDQVAAIEAGIFSEPWSKKGFLDSLRQQESIYVTALLDGKVVGYCGLLQSFDEADITNVAVEESARGQGVATSMLTELLKLGRKRGILHVTLEVRVSNANAIHLYEKLGFSGVGVRKNFYELPKEDALIMWRHETLA